jgi:hypothetical protein
MRNNGGAVQLARCIGNDRELRRIDEPSRRLNSADCPRFGNGFCNEGDLSATQNESTLRVMTLERKRG